MPTLTKQRQPQDLESLAASGGGEVKMDLGQLSRVASFLGIVPQEPKSLKPVRFGLLGASQVGTYAMIWPSKSLPTAKVVAVAARDINRATQYARQHRIDRVHGSYEELLADPDVDAVYVGLPNGLHGYWTQRAIQAGKHVLCEKPFATNAHEARLVQNEAISQGVVCREAFHYREHPMATRLRELTLGSAADLRESVWQQDPMISEAVLGNMKSIDVRVLIPAWVFGGENIRFSEQLAGGAMMDAGCYAINLMRLLTGSEPLVTSAEAELRPGSAILDGAMKARLAWPALPGLKGTLHASLQDKAWFPVTDVKVIGERGELCANGFIMPHFGHSIRVNCNKPSTVTTAAQPKPAGWFSANKWTEAWEEHAYGSDQTTTYVHQLRRFVRDVKAVKGHGNDDDREQALRACMYDQVDAVANQQLVDDIYLAAGLPIRMPTQPLKI